MTIRHYAFLIILAIGFIGCTKDSEICIDVEQPEFLCPGIPVQFMNCGPEDKYTWDFGDTIGSDSMAPAHIYKNPGNYRVKVKAGKGKKRVQDSLDIVVALPVGLSLVLNSMPTLAPDGDTWDPNGSAPDLRLWIFDETGSTIYNTAQVNNVSLPITFDLGNTTLCQDCSWRFLILDSQNGGDFDTVWEYTGTYDDLATKRLWEFQTTTGDAVNLSFKPH